MDVMLPFTQQDENEVNKALSKEGFYGIMAPRALAHHYSFGPQQQALDEHVGMEAVANYFLGG